MLQWPEDQFEKVLAHELGHVLGFFHVFEGGYVMGFPEAAAWSAEESEYAQLAYRVGPNVRYPGLLRDDDLPPGDDGERAALTALYDATDGRNWTDGTHWDSGEPLARWHGVLTDDDGRVTGLSLPANNLAGPLPAEFGDLSSLRYLEVASNRLSGPLPASLTGLRRLETLYIEDNAGLCAPADDAFQAWLATVRGISRWGCAPNPRPALAGTPSPRAAFPGWGCAPNPRPALAGTPSPRAALAVRGCRSIHHGASASAAERDRRFVTFASGSLDASNRSQSSSLSSTSRRSPNPHISPAFCCGRRSARFGGPYSLTPLRRSYDYVCSGVQSVRPTTPAPRRPRDEPW